MAIDLNGSTGISLDDNEKINIGNDSDLQIYHDGSNSYIDDTASGSLVIRGSTVYLQKYTGEYMLDAVADGAVTLYHNSASKLATTATGIQVTGSIAAGAATFTTADNTNQLTLVSTDADANAGPNLNFRRNSASPADGDLTGQLTFTNNNDAGEGTDYATMYTLSADVSNGSEDAAFYIKTMSAGTLRQRISLTDTATVFNEDSIDLDFRVESDNLTHALFVQGSDGNVGVGTSSPSADFVVSNGGAAGIELQPEIATDTNRITNYDRAASAYMNFRLDALTHSFLTSNTERMSITSAGAKNFGVHQSESGGFNIFAGAGSTASFAARFEGTGTGASNVVQITNGYGEVGSIKIASNGTTTNYNTGSDYRLKTDVQPVTDASARIQSLNPVNFEWIRSGTRTDGFLAHEAQAVVPDCVSGDKDAMKDEGYEVTPAVLDDDGNVTTEAVMGTRNVPDYQGIDQSKLVPLLTAALQEALTEIASLKTRVEALEA